MVDDCKCKNCGCGKMSYEEMVYQIEDQTLPFVESVEDNYRIRAFDPEAPAHLFKWHWDEDDRIVEPLNLNDWRFQFDNELPQPFDKPITIKAGQIHRVIPGNSPLNVKITAP